jgi:flagella basal body P-ring formation protein FlgA
MRARWFLRLGALGWALAAPLPALGAAPDPPTARVYLREAATVRGPHILLRDVARIESAHEAFAELVGLTEVGTAPLPGMSRALDPEGIRIYLRQHRFEPDRVAVFGVGRLTVTAASRLLGADEILRAVEEYLRAQRPPDEEGEIRIEPLAIPRELAVPDGLVELRVRTVLPGRLLGSVPVRVDIVADGRAFRSLPVTVRIQLFREVLVAARAIPRHGLLRAEDLRLDRRDVAGLPPGAFQAAAAAVGKRATKPLSTGEALTPASVEDPPAVRRGDLVTLLAEAGGLRITTRGEAREEGRPGQVVRVRNLASEREVYGRVVNGNTVRVEF